jgi:PAS domain S-box-containing protein
MMGTVQDITERRRAEDSLRLLEEKFAKAFLASPDWIVITRVADGRYLEVNEAFLKITGYSRAEVIGRTSLELGIWAEPEERTRMLQLLDEHGKVRNFDVRFRIRSGEVRSMLWSAEVIELHDEACLIALARDVTEQRQLENELLKSQAKLFRKHEELQKVFDQVRIAKREWERTMDCVADMVILGDREGRIKRCNKAFQEFVGRPFAEILGADWAELLHQHELITGTIFLQSLELYHAPSGRWFTLNPYQFTDPQHEEASGTIIIIHDTTEQQLMSQKLESYQQAATLPTGTR